MIAWAGRYELDPYAGHVIFYRGKPFVTEQGAVAFAARKLGKRYQGFSCRPLHEADLKALGYDAVAGDCGWECSVWIADYKVPITDYGIVTYKEREETARSAGANAKHLPLIKTPMLLAKARAVRRAFRLAAPLDLNDALADELEILEPSEAKPASTALVGPREKGEAMPWDEPEPGGEPAPTEPAARPRLIVEDFLALSVVDQANELIKLSRKYPERYNPARPLKPDGNPKTAIEMTAVERLALAKAVLAAPGLT